MCNAAAGGRSAARPQLHRLRCAMIAAAALAAPCCIDVLRYAGNATTTRCKVVLPASGRHERSFFASACTALGHSRPLRTGCTAAGEEDGG